MEKGLKEYFAKLRENFWQPDNNLRIKHELGYDLQNGVDMSWFFSAFDKPKKLDPIDYVFSLDFYKFYNSLILNEPSMLKFLGILPISYHKLIIKHCSDAFEALTIIIPVVENDWSLSDLDDYFKRMKN